MARARWNFVLDYTRKAIAEENTSSARKRLAHVLKRAFIAANGWRIQSKLTEITIDVADGSFSFQRKAVDFPALDAAAICSALIGWFDCLLVVRFFQMDLALNDIGENNLRKFEVLDFLRTTSKESTELLASFETFQENSVIFFDSASTVSFFFWSCNYCSLCLWRHKSISFFKI